jgi:hypothetical protein
MILVFRTTLPVGRESQRLGVEQFAYVQLAAQAHELELEVVGGQFTWMPDTVWPAVLVLHALVYVR